jgi:PleD family two-component response regulator
MMFGLETAQSGKESLQEVAMAESRNQRILIVDNDEQESSGLEATVQGAGYDTIATWSGLEALDLLKSQKIDILLVSSYLPDLYIGDFLARLRSLPVQPCSIVMEGGHERHRGVIKGHKRDWRGKTPGKMKAAVSSDGCDPEAI